MVRVATNEAAAVYVGADSVWTANAPGMVLINPTSITYSGTSASKGANGQVTFTAVTSLSLNGVFSADFDNYVISLRAVSTLGDFACNMRWRASGTDASGSDYTFQVIEVNGTSVTGSRSSSQSSTQLAKISDPLRSGYNTQVYGPFLAQPTAHRTVTSSANGNAVIYDVAGTHSLSTSYDGFTLTMAGGTMAGALQVYGVRS